MNSVIGRTIGTVIIGSLYAFLGAWTYGWAWGEASTFGEAALFGLWVALLMVIINFALLLLVLIIMALIAVAESRTSRRDR